MAQKNASRLASRAFCVRMDESGKPASLDEATRSVEVVASTEEPVWVFDWESWQPVRESLLMSGLSMPESGRIVLLDSHSRESVSDIIGSFRDMRLEDGPTCRQLVGRIFFSGTPEGQSAFRKVAEGHLTDVSVGYEVLAFTEIREGESVEIGGRIFTGPLRVANSWRLFELSLCPIGADAKATVRAKKAAAGRKEKSMDKKEKRGLLARLRDILRKREEEKQEDENAREDTPAGVLVDENGAPIDPESLSDAQLEEVIDDLEAALGEAEDEQAAREEGAEDGQKPEDTAGGQRKKAARGRYSGLGRSPVLGERERIAGISALARAHGLSAEQEKQMVDSGVSLTRAKAQVLDIVEGRRGLGPGFHVSHGQGESEKFRAAAHDALMLRVGAKTEKPAPGAEELRGLSLRELAREFVARSGQSVHGDVRQIVGRALTSTDLPGLLVDVSRRVLMEAFEAAPETWREWASTGTATDFKKTTAIGLEGDVKPKLTPEYGEMTEGRLAENAEEFQIATYTRKLVISRQAIINDDLNALQVVPRLYGEQTAEMVGDVAYDALLKAPTMGDGKPLFDAAHLNIFAGAGGLPTIDSLGKVVTGMKLQQDSFGNVITVLPKIFLAPVAMEVGAESFFNLPLAGSIASGQVSQPLAYNPFGGAYFKRVYDRRLDVDDSRAWYLLAQRNTVCVYFLGGVESPYIESQTNFDTDGFESKVRMDVGAKALRWVTVAKATK